MVFKRGLYLSGDEILVKVCEKGVEKGGDDMRRNGFDTNDETHSVLVAWLGRCPRSERLIDNSLVGNLKKEQWQMKKN